MKELNKIKLNTAEKETYHELKEKLLLSTHPEEVLFYEEQIHELLDKAEKRTH